VIKVRIFSLSQRTDVFKEKRSATPLLPKTSPDGAKKQEMKRMPLN